MIGYGSPQGGDKQSTRRSDGPGGHGGDEEVFWISGRPELLFPEDALANWRKAVNRGADQEAEWNNLFAGYKAKFPELAAEFERTQKGELKAGWLKAIPTFPADKPVATRNAGQAVINAIADSVPELFGGAADLTASTKTIFKDRARSFPVDPAGRNVFFGVREFGNVRGSEWNGSSRRVAAVRVDILYLF